MNKLLNVSLSPHVRSHETTHSIMLDVAIVTLPATAFGVYYFGMHALLVLIVTVAVCVLSEYAYGKLMKGQSTINDCNAPVTDMVLMLNMLPEIPVWILALGGILAIIVVRQLHGGLGQSFMNPTLAARCFLLISFARKTTNFNCSGFNGVPGATSPVMPKNGQAVDVPAMFVGSIPGTIGEVSMIALLIDAAYLLAKKVISVRTPGTYILTVVVSAILFGGHGFDLNCIMAHLCDGGLIFGAFFMAADYVTSSITPKSRIVLDILLGVLMGLFKVFGGSVEGVLYAIIISNILIPLIEKVTPPEAFGKGGK